MLRPEEDLRQAEFERASSRVRVPTSILDRDLEARLQPLLSGFPTWEKRKDAVVAAELPDIPDPDFPRRWVVAHPVRAADAEAPEFF